MKVSLGRGQQGEQSCLAVLLLQLSLLHFSRLSLSRSHRGSTPKRVGASERERESARAREREREREMEKEREREMHA